MLEADVIRSLAEELDEAERSATQVEQISRRYPDMDIADSYAIQRSWTDIKLAAGRRILGHKIGLTSRAMQQAVNIDEPDYGVLFDDMFLSETAPVDTSRLIEPRIEAEIAFVLSRDLSGPHCTIVDALEATSYVMPALELLDARMHRVDPETGRMRKVFDTIADNAANCAIITGGRPMRPLDLDLRRVSAIVHKNAIVEETGVAAGVLNHPANGVAWLANRLSQWGESLKAGEVILSGSFIRPIPAGKGDVFQADFGEMGTVGCRFD